MSERIEPALTADDLVLKDPGAIQTSPKKDSPTSVLGNAYMQYGAYCERKQNEGSSSCFLEGPQRTTLIRQVENRITDAMDSYVDALINVQVHRLVQSDDDLPFVAVLILDIVTAGISSRLSSTVKALRNAGAGRLDEIASHALIGGLPRNWAERALPYVRVVSDTRIETGVKSVVDGAKRATSARLKADHALTRTDKAETLDYLEDLKEQAKFGFIRVRETIPATADDSELLTLFESLDPTQHSERMYVSLLTEKLSRFKRSGVPEIGRKVATVTELPGPQDPMVESMIGEEVLRDTQVVWVQHTSGLRELRYQTQDGERVHSVLHPGGEHHPRKAPPEFGPAEPRGGPERSRPVPGEFVDAALSRHRQVWGKEPETIHVEPHSHIAFFDQIISDAQKPHPSPPSSYLEAFHRGTGQQNLSKLPDQSAGHVADEPRKLGQGT